MGDRKNIFDMSKICLCFHGSLRISPSCDELYTDLRELFTDTCDRLRLIWRSVRNRKKNPCMWSRYKVFYPGFASVNYLSQRRHPRAKTWQKIWMTSPLFAIPPLPTNLSSLNFLMIITLREYTNVFLQPRVSKSNVKCTFKAGVLDSSAGNIEAADVTSRLTINCQLT